MSSFLLFSYKGPVNFQIKKELKHTVKKRIEIITKSSLEQKRIHYVFDEMVSNVYEYYKENDFYKETTSIKMYVKSQNSLEIVMSSTLGKTDKKSFKGYIDFINSLNEVELRKFHRKKLNENMGLSDNGGIGLISIRRKSGNPIDYMLKKEQTKYVIFLKTIINLKNG
ncbi:MAG TPA: DUF6272 family protein [Bacteroidia bacterium]|jgi:hypothetical protein|nr:DUF6272 family protein [Bacteroidia bacterium]